MLWRFALGVAIVLLVGFLFGWTWAVQAYDRRSRAQAASQRRLNDGWSRFHRARWRFEQARRPDR